MADEKKSYSAPQTYTPPVAALLTIGEPDPGKWLDYPRLYHLTADDAPELVRMVQDEGLNWASSESLEVWVSVHAWRALAQLQVESALPALVASLFMIDAHQEGDWAQDEMPEVLAKFGAAAIPHLQPFLADTQNGQWSRITAADALVAIARQHPDTRSQCLNILSQQLALHRSQNPTFNAFLISALLDLDAVEAVDTIKGAFTARSVDLSIAGDWEEVEIQLGLRSQRVTPPPRWGWLNEGMTPFIKQATEHKPPLATPKASSPPKVGRNDPCPCGSGLKYKKCHGKPGGK